MRDEGLWRLQSIAANSHREGKFGTKEKGRAKIDRRVILYMECRCACTKGIGIFLFYPSQSKRELPRRRIVRAGGSSTLRACFMRGRLIDCRIAGDRRRHGGASCAQAAHRPRGGIGGSSTLRACFMRGRLFFRPVTKKRRHLRKSCAAFLFLCYNEPANTDSRLIREAASKNRPNLWGKFPLWGQQLGGAISSSGAGSSCEGGAPCGRAHPLGGAASHRAAIRKIQNGGFYDP